MKKVLKKLKSNKGFTMQDVVIAFTILSLFAALIGSTYVAIYKMQLETKLNATATLYAIQIIENIDKISYDEVATGMESTYRTTYGIPSVLDVSIVVTQYDTNDTIKIVKLTISYELSGDTETLVIEKAKIKEL